MKAKLRYEYTRARDMFDKRLRWTEREYKRLSAAEIENMCTKNPNDFWAKIRNLGPKTKKALPLEIIDETGKIINDEKVVLDKWHTDFKNLYNGSNSGDFDQGHFKQVRAHTHFIEWTIRHIRQMKH